MKRFQVMLLSKPSHVWCMTNTDLNCIKLEQYLQHKLFFLSKISPWGLLGAYVHAREGERERKWGVGEGGGRGREAQITKAAVSVNMHC